MEECLREMKKEVAKEELNKITKDLKSAEEMKDKDAVEFLKNQFKKIIDKLKN